MPFEMKFLHTDSLPDLVRLQNVIAANLPCPEIFMQHDDRYFQEILQLERSVIGMINDKELIAYSMIHFPGISDDNLGRDISLPEEELTKNAHLQAVAVHPAYRGHGLQRKLTFAHLDVIEELGYEHACCTVSPKNPVSLGNDRACGLAIEGLRPKMHGWGRFILHKNIPQVNQLKIEQKRVAISDIAGHLDLLSKGFKGFRISPQCEGKQAQIFYAKF